MKFSTPKQATIKGMSADPQTAVKERRSTCRHSAMLYVQKTLVSSTFENGSKGPVPLYRPELFSNKSFLFYHVIRKLQHQLGNRHFQRMLTGRPHADFRPDYSAFSTPGIQRTPGGKEMLQRLPATRVGPISVEGGLIHDSSRKRLSVIIGVNDTLRSIAARILPLWQNATPSTPEGSSAPIPLTALTEEQLAQGLLVYHRYYLPVPSMSNWQVGLRLPLPVEINQVTGEHFVNPQLIATWAASFDPQWMPLLDQRAGAAAVPGTAELSEAVRNFLAQTTSTSGRGIHLSARAIRNAAEAAPFITETFRQLGTDAFATALSFMDNIVVHQFDLLASQTRGQEIITAVRDVLEHAPASPSAEQQASLARAHRLLNRLGVFSAQTSEMVRQIYAVDVPGSHCMQAVYWGLRGLYSAEVSQSIRQQVERESRKVMRRTGRDTNHMDRIMQTVRQRGLAGPEHRLTYDRSSDSWTPDPETTVLGMTHADVAGWYFFGFSIHGAYHSVILAVDKTDPNHPQIYWMDQFSRGFTNNVTGRLPDEMRIFHPSYGFAPTRLWQLIPAAGTLVQL